MLSRKSNTHSLAVTSMLDLLSMFNMLNMLYFLLFSKIITATSFMSYNASSVSAQNAEAAAESSYDSSYSAGLFIDCSSYSAAHLASSNAPSASITYAISTPASIKTPSSTSIVPFEQYWCDNNWDGPPANTPDSFPNNGTLEPWFFDLNASDKEFCLSLEKANYSSWAAASPTSAVFGNFTEPPSWQPTLTPPCCDTFCNIEASAVQLYFWPTPAPIPNVTTILGADGFTFTSPSVYLVYKDVSAYGQCGQVGPTYASLTLPYDPSDISTFGYGATGHLDYANLFSNCTSRAADYSYPQADCASSTDWINSPSCVSQVDSLASVVTFDQIHCYPYLNYPSGLQAVNPAWSTCVDTNFGGHFASVFDPPHALTPASALAPIPTKTSSLSGAAPASHATDPTPVKTAAPKVTSQADEVPNHLPTDVSPPVGNDPPVGSDTPSENDPPAGNDPPVESDPFIESASPIGNVETGPSKAGSDSMKGAPSAALQVGQAAPSEDSIEYHSAIVPGPTATTIQGHVLQVVTSSPGGILFDGQFIAPESASAFVSGTPIALSSNGDLVLGSTTFQHLISISVPTPEPTVKVGSQTLTISSNIIIGAGQTLKPNDPAINIDGTIVSLGGSELRIGSSTIALTPEPSSLPALIINAAGQLVTLLSSGVAIASATLTANAPAITVSGTRISLGENWLVVGTSTINLPSPPPIPSVTIANQVYAVSRVTNGLVIAGTTLQNGQAAITISGNAIALATSSLIINGTSTVLFANTDGPQPTPSDIGDYVIAGLNGGPAANPPPVGATSVNQTQKTTTGEDAGGVEAFQGRGITVEVRLVAILSLTLTVTLLKHFLF